MKETKYTVTITEALKVYNGKVSRTIYTKWVNKGDYGLEGIKVNGVWHMTEESVIKAKSLYLGITLNHTMR